jgi:hypothetical protein
MFHPALFVSRLQTRNTGDLLCSPLLYFRRSYPGAVQTEVHFPRGGRLGPLRRGKLRLLRDSAQIVILGGGGLIGNNFHKKDMAFWSQGRAPTVIWGAGHNCQDLDTLEPGGPKGVATSTPDDSHYAQTIPFRAIGIRDWGPGFTWVPCASCLHPALGKTPKDNGRVLFGMHLDIRKNERMLHDILQRATGDYDVVFNDEPADVIFGKLRDARYVVANSYHLAYWATLLGKPVVVVGGGTKVRLLKHPVTVANPATWPEALDRAARYPNALEECRDRNNDFHKFIQENYVESKIWPRLRSSFSAPVQERRREFAAFKHPLPAIVATRVPKVVHFIVNPSPNTTTRHFNILHCLAIQSVAERFKPEQILFHCNNAPDNDYFQRIRHLVSMTPLSESDLECCDRSHGTNIVRLRKLYETGGIYLSLDTVTVRSFEPFLDRSFTIGLLGKHPVLGFSNAVMVAAPRDNFVGEWLERSEQRFEQADLGLADPVWQLPYLMWRSGKHSINVEAFDQLNWPLWDDAGMRLMFERRHSCAGAYCHHLWQSTSVPKYFPDEPYLDAIARLQHMNSTYTRLIAEFI